MTNLIIDNGGVNPIFHKDIVMIEQHDYGHKVSFYSWTLEYWMRNHSDIPKPYMVAKFLVKPKLTPAV